jgi:hypothetical protein
MRTRDGLFPVLFVMTSQFDLSTLDLEGLDRDERQRRIIAALQEHARVTQADVWAYIEALPPGQIVSNAQSLWLVNAIFADADEPAIRALAARADIGYAYIDLPGPGWPSPVAPSTWGQLKASFLP